MHIVAQGVENKLPSIVDPVTGNCGGSSPAFGQSVFPPEAVAHIFRPSRSPMTSNRAGSRDWKLVFERSKPHFIEPLMGWTGDDDILAQVKLTFPTREAAIAYAQRQGLSFIVDND